MSGDLHLTAGARLRPIGQRYTPNRRAVVEILLRAARPLSIAEILAGRDGLPQSSVYRNLLVLEQAGIVRRVAGSDEYSRYELAEDLIGHHHHLICSSCGSVQDFEAPRQLEQAVARTIDRVVDESGFAIEGHHLQLTGVCRDCS